MPYVHLKVSRPLTEQQIEEARLAIAGIMPSLPGKNRDNTMIHITGSCALSMGDEGKACMFLEVRLFRPSPEESKKEFLKKAAEALCALFEIEPTRMYVNLIELNEWGVGDRLLN